MQEERYMYNAMKMDEVGLYFDIYFGNTIPDRKGISLSIHKSKVSAVLDNVDLRGLINKTEKELRDIIFKSQEV